MNGQRMNGPGRTGPQTGGPQTGERQMSERQMSGNVLEVSDLRVQIASRRGLVRAVDGVSLEVPRGARWAWSGSPARARA